MSKINDLPITREFVEAVLDGAMAMDSLVTELRKSEHFNAQNTVGTILRYNVELSLQRQAVLKDFVRRSRPIVGLPPLQE